MKKIFLFISLISLALTSCDDSNGEIKSSSDESGWVQFETTSTSGGEGLQEQFRIPVNLVSVTNLQGTKVSFTATDVNNNNNGYLTWDETITIDKDTKQGYLIVNANTEMAITGKIVIDFTLTTTSNNFEVGLSDGTKTTTHRLQICPLNRSAFLGTYDAVEDEEYEYVCVVTAGEASNEIIISNVYGVNPGTKTHVFLNFEDSEFSVDFPPFEDNFLFTDAEAGEIFVSDGSGTFDPCESVLDLEFSLRTAGAVLTNPINLVLTKR